MSPFSKQKLLQKAVNDINPVNTKIAGKKQAY